MELVQEIGSYAGLAAVLGLAVLSGLYFSQGRDVKRLREWAGSGAQPAGTDPEMAARAASAPTGGAVTPKPAVPKAAAGPATVAGKPVTAAAGAKPATAAGKQAPPVPGAPQPAGAPATAQQPLPATAQGAATTAGKAPAAATSPDGATAAAPAPPTAPGKTAVGGPPQTTTAGPPRIPRPGTPGNPPTLPPRRPGQTRIVPPYQASPPEAKSSGPRGLLARPRTLVLVLLGVLVVGGGLAYGALQLTGEDKPASEQAGGGGGGGGEGKGEGGASAPVDPSTITVSVLNGTTVPGLAAQVGDEIERKGFQLGNVTNSAEQGARAESVVLFSPGNEREAKAVGRRLKISQREEADAESQGLAGDATVIVVAGQDQTR